MAVKRITFLQLHPELKRILRPVISVFRFRRKIRATAQKEVLDNLQSLLVEEPCIKVPEFCGDFFCGSTFRFI